MARRMIVTGHVQGVFFRDSTREEATRLGVRGWVRNRDDGTVEALVDGPQDAVDALIAWAHDGPASASVSRVVSEDSDDEAPDGFEVR